MNCRFISSAGLGLVFYPVYSKRSCLPEHFRRVNTSLWKSFMLIWFSSRTWSQPTLPNIPNLHNHGITVTHGLWSSRITNADSLKATIEATLASLSPQQNNRLSPNQALVHIVYSICLLHVVFERLTVTCLPLKISLKQ